MSEGFLFAFEGIDGSGKTTLIKSLTDAIKKGGFDVSPVAELYTRPLGRHVALGLTKDLDRISEALLYGAARMDLWEGAIEPFMKAGHVVLVDRFIMSGYAITGSKGVDVRWLQNIMPFVTPTHTFVLDLPVEDARKRFKKGESGRFCTEEIRKGYLAQSLNLGAERCTVLDALKTPSEIFDSVLSRIASYLLPQHLEPQHPSSLRRMAIEETS